MWLPEETAEGIDLVWNQPEFGIGPSALKGNANLQNVNIATEPGQVMASFDRTNQSQATISAGTLTPDGATLFDAPTNLKSGTWISVTASTVSSITAATNPTTFSADYLIVGGGGAGGVSKGPDSAAGGGGGGGEVVDTSGSLSVQAYSITVGATSAGSTSITRRGQGTTSSIEDASASTVDSAEGGGAGGAGYQNVYPTTNFNGGSVTDSGAGGGGAEDGTAGTGGVSTNGGDGGDSYDGGATNDTAAGGGGSTANAGTNAVADNGGDGGDGTTSTISGSSVVYGGGGGGGGRVGGSAGTGGGGDGAGINGTGVAGTDGLGGGGSGTYSDNNTAYAGGDGGSGVVIISYPTGSAYCIGGAISYTATNTIHTFTENDVFEVLWINPGGYYYVSYDDSSDKIKLSSAYDPYGASAITHGTTGSITFDTLATPGKPIAKATERYYTSTGEEYRYYILDDNSYVWVYDTLVYSTTLASNGVGTTWAMPDATDSSNEPIQGIGVLNGWLMMISNRKILCKPTVTLGLGASFMAKGYLTNPFPNHPNHVYTGSQGTLLYTDGNFLGEIFPTTSLVTSIANLQSYCEYSAVTTTGTVDTLFGGSIPAPSNDSRLPVVFFTSPGGTLPTAITANTVYFIEYNLITNTFEVRDDLTANNAVLDMATGATGTQYFNTFYPVGTDAGVGGTNPSLQFSPQRMNLPFYETATRIIEIGNTVLVGCKGNIIYPWNQVDAVPSDVITLPEDGVTTMINVNNTAYIFAGDKGNVYVTNNVVASLALKVPDYMAGVPGTPNSYIEPTFTWGDAIFCRGRVYCSILDETATKAGNVGGILSFIPSENIDPSQEVGMALRLENQNSYGDYNGYAPILINDREQDGKSPKYWAAWQDSYDDATASFGIDYSSENPVTTYVLETDLLNSGTFLQKKTFEQLEYKLSVPLASGESVQLYWRTDPTGTWTSAGTVRQEDSNPISGYYEVNFEKTQWVQIRAEVTTTGVESTSTFVPLREIRIR